MAKIYVVIVTYNAMRWVDRCLNCIRNSSVLAKAIVVDNVSTDNTVEYIKTNYPEVILFPQTKNLGFCGGNNFGIKYAIQNEADYIYLLNQDAWFDKNTLKVLVDCMESHTDFGIISPLQTNAEETRLDENYCKAIIRDERHSLVLFNSLLLQKRTNLYEADFFQAAHWFISSKCISEVGLFSPIFKHYGEDGNYLKRVQYHGFKTGICINTCGVHERENRNDDNFASKMFFYYMQYLDAATNVKYSKGMHFKKMISYSFLALIYLISIYMYFLFNPSEKRSYFKNIPNPIKIHNDYKNSRNKYGK